MNPEAQLPIVYQTAANLYQAELFSLQLQGGRVRHLVCNFHTFTCGPPDKNVLSGKCDISGRYIV